jgi:hypothetical protein
MFLITCDDHILPAIARLDDHDLTFMHPAVWADRALRTAERLDFTADDRAALHSQIADLTVFLLAAAAHCTGFDPHALETIVTLADALPVVCDQIEVDGDNDHDRLAFVWQAFTNAESSALRAREALADGGRDEIARSALVRMAAVAVLLIAYDRRVFDLPA